MSIRSAGLLPFRITEGNVEVLLAHMGGPLWMRRDAGAWTVVKGEIGEAEEPFAAARREFGEELGIAVPRGPYIELGSITQSGGKRVFAWAVAADIDPATITPGTFEMEWPPRSGRRAVFPEVDRAAWLSVERAREVIIPGQRVLLERLVTAVDSGDR